MSGLLHRVLYQVLIVIFAEVLYHVLRSLLMDITRVVIALPSKVFHSEELERFLIRGSQVPLPFLELHLFDLPHVLLADHEVADLDSPWPQGFQV